MINRSYYLEEIAREFQAHQVCGLWEHVSVAKQPWP